MDTTVPHSARVWNYWLGGTDNYPVDRDLGNYLRRPEQIIRLFEGVRPVEPGVVPITQWRPDPNPSTSRPTKASAAESAKRSNVTRRAPDVLLSPLRIQ